MASGVFPCNFLMSSELSFVFLILITTGACFGPRSSVGAGQGSALCEGRVFGVESTSQVLVPLLQELREVHVSSWFKERACMLSGFSHVPTLCDPMDYRPPGSSVHSQMDSHTVSTFILNPVMKNLGFPSQQSWDLTITVTYFPVFSLGVKGQTFQGQKSRRKG